VQERPRALAFITPKPWRGDLIAAGAVPLAVGLLAAELRLGWSKQATLAVTVVAAASLLGMALLSPLEFARPRSYQVVLLVTGLVLTLLAIFELANVLDAPRAAKTSAWMAALFALIASGCAWWRNAWICTLLAALSWVATLVALVDWLFAAGDRASVRYVLLGAVAALVLGSVLLRGGRPRHAAALVVAAGLAVVAIVVLLLIDRYAPRLLATYFSGRLEPSSARAGVAWGWELVVLAAGCGLVAFSGADHERAPGYLGVVTLLGFVALVAPVNRGGARSIVGWPLALLVIGGLAIASGLRPSRPLPPEPGGASDGDALPPIQLRPGDPS